MASLVDPLCNPTLRLDKAVSEIAQPDIDPAYPVLDPTYPVLDPIHPVLKLDQLVLHIVHQILQLQLVLGVLLG